MRPHFERPLTDIGRRFHVFLASVLKGQHDSLSFVEGTHLLVKECVAVEIGVEDIVEHDLCGGKQLLDRVGRVVDEVGSLQALSAYSSSGSAIKSPLTHSPRSRQARERYMAAAAITLGGKGRSLRSKHPISMRNFDTVLV